MDRTDTPASSAHGQPLPLSRLTQLDLLRAFVAVGRTGSVTAAAAGLCLTQSAVSRQLKALESRLGVVLFRREHSGMQLTVVGRRLFDRLDPCFLGLQRALGAVLPERRRAEVVVSAAVGVAGLWLMPRLPRAGAAVPGVDLRISASGRVLSSLRSEGVDLAIRFGPPATDGELLFEEWVAPVVAPGVDPAGMRLLELDGCPGWLGWDHWAGAWRGLARRHRRRLTCSNADQLVHACVAGQGIAVGRLALIHPLVDAGRLVLLERPVRSPTRHAYRLLIADPASPDALEVAAWLRDEAEATRAALDALVHSRGEWAHAPESLAQEALPGG
ncbi:LysR family transcriptional regulator [Coralloluteibacterium thermophilus]|uniref:LysR family transcriptional regulator n=1 Tax=Coralloluteibacterium thermophilum TaxID=2707049 RepID=A0ABV9NLM4_9GAMM